MDVVIARLDALRERFEDERRMNAERHEQNVEHMEKIHEEVRRTNGRVTALETINATADRWPSLPVWLMIVGGSLATGWFVLTALLGFHR